MATYSPARIATRTSTAVAAALEDEERNYGSDFSPEEEQLLAQILNTPSATEDSPITSAVEHYEPERKLRLPRVLGREGRSALFEAAKAADEVAKQINGSVSGGETYLDLSNQLKGTKVITPDNVENNGDANATEPKRPDTRSPLERFRTQPRKGLSVTDLVSPAWCELQYWYSLTLHGRKKRTPEMKQGSRVHQVLEDQVHTTVTVEVATIEDRWGLRIWNVIQGLQSLRNYGLTRELEIWGTIDGLVVNGVIDELSYICPDADLEETFERAENPISTSGNELPPNQATISEYFKAAKGSSLKEGTRIKQRTQTKKIYLCDVKTRGAKTLPSGAAFRPTKMQLMLYHDLLSALATNKVDFSIFTKRYGLDPDKSFSDAFIAQVGSLNEEFFDTQTSPDPNQESLPSSQNSLHVLLEHNDLSTLWGLMIKEFQITLPDGASSLGKVLKAEYRSRDAGEVLGSKTFAMDEKELKSYLDHEMAWWKGERKAEGVAIEEAYKCRSCEFAETCEWRLEKVEEATQKSRAKRKKSVAA
ncbi:hypothetical protein HYALB_00011609 [Hymenoscyphus albidus]|uniref:Exonuclease V n=1 Tax=Hymenoscyphus albidus TaxID=595503 RepID=A0A9N9LPN5_9HELO|nr:hypothetical protein HYALB_00011609 [Hymenoscyphus albidus]